MKYVALALMSALVMETSLSLWGMPGLVGGLAVSTGFVKLLWWNGFT